MTRGGLVLVLLAMATLAGADAGDQDLIHACLKSTGSLHIIGPNDVCASAERPLHWVGQSGVEVVEALSEMSTSPSNNANPECPPGKAAFGGSYAIYGANTGVRVIVSEPSPVGGTPIGWFVLAVDDDGGSWQLGAYAVCANVFPPAPPLEGPPCCVQSTSQGHDIPPPESSARRSHMR